VFDEALAAAVAPVIIGIRNQERRSLINSARALYKWTKVASSFNFGQWHFSPLGGSLVTVPKLSGICIRLEY
jgi:hypothetical protein